MERQAPDAQEDVFINHMKIFHGNSYAFQMIRPLADQLRKSAPDYVGKYNQNNISIWANNFFFSICKKKFDGEK